MNGRLISVTGTPESSILAFSAASLSRWRDWRSRLKSTPSFSKNPSASQSTIFLSKFRPPSCVSPLVERTSNTPSPTSNTDTSNVPPPRSNTRIVWLYCWSRPYANEAAVGSLMIRFTSSPAIRPASRVACRCASLKYAGTVITAPVTGWLRYCEASSASFRKIIAEISSGAKSLSSRLLRSFTLPLSPRRTV